MAQNSRDTAPSPVPLEAATRTLPVHTTEMLRQALLQARCGDRILLSPGEYRGPFVLQGKAGVSLCGPGLGPGADPGAAPSATLLTTHGGKPCLLVQECQRCTVHGLTLQGGQKSVMVHASSDCVLDHLDMGRTKMEACHFRAHSQRNTVQFCLVHDTGLGGDHPAGHGRTQADDGEGIYIGTALSNTPRQPASSSTAQTSPALQDLVPGPDKDAMLVPDRSDGTRILFNRIWNTSVESIDIKEFTSAGVVVGNALDGGVARSRGVKALVECKGTNYYFAGNVFTQPTQPLLIKVFSIRGAVGSGADNVVSDDNQAQ